MKTQAAKAITAIVIVLSICSTLSPVSLAQNHTISYRLLDRQGENAAYTLNIIVPEALLQYYEGSSHRLSTLSDFARFVTPDAVKPIADCLRQIYPDDEDFVNGALMIVHQIDYVETKRGKYPAETLADNQGDCDIFSAVAASIIKAGGIDVVLLDYEEKNHMNIGVHLASPPVKARTEVYKVTYENDDYYVAETTGGNWTSGWRVGECPDITKQTSAKVITLENAEMLSPGQVSASFKKLEDSQLSLEIWPPITLDGTTVTLKGSLTPTKPNENVTIYLGVSGFPWTILGTVRTRADGTFAYTWTADTAGTYAVRAIWAGDNTFAGSTSETMSATVIPLFLGALIVVAVIAIVVAIIAVLASRHTAHDNLIPMEPEPPTLS
jgi:hypothetical protein